MRTSSARWPHIHLVASFVVLVFTACRPSKTDAPANLHAELRAVVDAELQKLEMTPAVEEELDKLIDSAAHEVANNPEREQEARTNLVGFARALYEESPDSEGFSGADKVANSPALTAALARICPIWPVCR
jgi:hypothetical protein